MIVRKHISAATLTFMLLSPALLRAEDMIEKAGVATGMSAGNMWFLPIKLISVTIGAISSGISYVVTGGDTEVAQQLWRDTQQGPYIIDAKLARMAVGQRPEIADKK